MASNMRRAHDLIVEDSEIESPTSPKKQYLLAARLPKIKKKK